MTKTDEDARRAALIAAEKGAEALLADIEATGLIAAGRSETEIEDDIGALALSRFGVERHWHRRIVRAGVNTLTTANDYPPVRIIEPDDTVYVDLGPVFAEWEADIGRTSALGGDGSICTRSKTRGRSATSLFFVGSFHAFFLQYVDGAKRLIDGAGVTCTALVLTCGQ
jgi:hypothetical protein